MGTHCSSELYRGHILKSKTATMKLLLLTALAAVALAEPEAEAGYYGYNHGFYGYGYGHQLNWPGYRAPGFSSQCFGCRGKRSAEADAEPGYYGYPSYGYGHYGYGYGLPGRSFAHFGGHFLGKRSAEAEADAEPGYYGHPYGYGLYRPYYGYRAYGPGIAGHPTGTSFTYRSPQGLGK